MYWRVSYSENVPSTIIGHAHTIKKDGVVVKKNTDVLVPALWCKDPQLIGFFIYFPLTAVLGGWDEGHYSDFAKCVKMAGPSKFIVVSIFKAVKYFGKKSPLNNKFIYDRTEAEQEARELLLLKQSGQMQLNT